MNFSDEGEVSVGMKPLGLKAWSCGEKKMETKLEENYRKSEGEGRRRMGAPVSRDSSG